MSYNETNCKAASNYYALFLIRCRTLAQCRQDFLPDSVIVFTAQTLFEQDGLRQLPQRPGGVAADEWLGVVQRHGERASGFRIAAVAQSDCDVAQQAAAFGAPNCTTSEARPKTGVVQGQQCEQ